METVVTEDDLIAHGLERCCGGMLLIPDDSVVLFKPIGKFYEISITIGTGDRNVITVVVPKVAVKPAQR